jgi:outer membrane protein assembly factor BamB
MSNRNCSRRRAALVVLGLLSLTFTLQAADWPQWRGPERNGVSSESGWLSSWPAEDSPKVAWRAAVGKGHSAVSVAQGRAVTVGWDGTDDTVYCFDVESGRLEWKRSYACAGILQWPGPRATPTIHGNSVYTLGQHGQLRAWDLRAGEPRWQRDLPAVYNPDVDYGFAWSPLIEGEHLILNAGSRGLALRTRDGSIAWGDDGKKGACVSAVPFVLDGKRAVLVASISDERSEVRLAGVDPATGRELFRGGPWKEQWGAMGVDPVVHGRHIFVTSAQEFRQAARFTIEGATLTQDWATQRVAGYTGGAVLLSERLYLVDAKGILKCVDWKTGKEVWSQRGFDERGTLIAADGKLLIQTGASGKIIVAAAEPTGYRELRQTRVFEGDPETYTAPVLANGRLSARSYAGEVVCFDLREKTKGP